MKQNWTYKKFGDAFDLQMGKTPSRDNADYWGGDNIWVSIADLKGKYVDETKEHITDIAVAESGINKVPQGTTIMSFKLTIGRAAITKCDLFTNEAIMSFVPKEAKTIDADYLYYYLKCCKWTGANKAVMGQTLNKKTIAENIFAYPPLAEQQRIVSELDLLQGIIDKQQAQLKELDTLAQSIFYDMFGDPVENEKGWEVKRLEEVCTLSQGLAINAKSKHLLIPTGDLPLLRIKDMKEGTREIFVDTKNCPKNCIAIPNDIIYTRTGTLGLVFTNMRGVIHNNCFKINIASSVLSKVFFMSFIGGGYFLNRITDLAKRSSQPDITHKLFLSQSIILPPLTLQQEFAEKIEKIERQKTAISKSIAETEKLFEYTMDKYFG